MHSCYNIIIEEKIHSAVIERPSQHVQHTVGYFPVEML
jgi:hypothetical protein